MAFLYFSGNLQPFYMKYLVLAFLVLFCSCSNKTKTINEELDEAFNDSVIKIGTKLYFHQRFPDWKAKVYIKDERIRLMQVTTMPELGFSDIQVYWTSSGRVEKIVHHLHLPDWESHKDKTTPPEVYTDTTLVVFPETGKLIKYDSEKCIGLVRSDSLDAKYITKSVDFYLENVESYLK